MIITVGGSVASGKSTLAKNLAEELGFKHVSAGEVMRAMAAEKGMTLMEFSRYAENSPEVDKEIDKRQMAEAVGDCVVDGRLSRYFLKPGLSIWLIAPLEERAKRVMHRGESYKTSADALTDVRDREESEIKRYMSFYGIDLRDLSVYDLVLNTGKFGIDETVELALNAVRLARSSLKKASG